MEAGKSPDEIAEIMNVGRSTVFEWQRKYREGGLAALSTKFASGRPTTLSDRQMLWLYSLIEGSDPRQYSFAAALWTLWVPRTVSGSLISAFDAGRRRRPRQAQHDRSLWPSDSST